jgi:hypothetical protein
VALVYAADLRMVKRATWEPAPIDEVRTAINTWAGVNGDVWDFDGASLRIPIAMVRSQWIAQEGDVLAWRLTFSRPDDQDANIRWTADTTVVSGSDTVVHVRLDRSRHDRTVSYAGDSPQPPGCIAGLITSETLAALDAGRELSVEPTLVDIDQAESFASVVCAATRRLPVFAYSPRDDDPIDGLPFSRALAGLAHVALVTSRASRALDQLLPRGVNVYGGAARTIWPGVSRVDRGPRHFLWYADTPSRTIFTGVVGSVTRAGLAQVREDPQIVEIERRRRQAELDAINAGFERLREETESGKLQAADFLDQLNRMKDEMNELGRERDLYQEWAEYHEGEVAALSEKNRSLEAMVEQWRMATCKVRARVGVPTGEADPEEQFRADVDSEVEDMGDVEGARRRQYSFGPLFVDAVDELGTSYYTRIVKVCAVAAVNAPELLGRYQDHVLRAGEGAGEKHRVRAGDGASAHRIAIEQNTPAARRLHYWVKPDASIEFASVNVHNDFDIPE